MTEVFERVKALNDSYKILPKEVSPSSAFGQDATMVPFKTYDIMRTRLQDGVNSLQIAARMAQGPVTSVLGTHLIALRAALVATARGWWLISVDNPAERVSRAAGLVIADREGGQSAMHQIAEVSDMPEIKSVEKAFVNAQAKLRNELRIVGLPIRKPPRDGDLVKALGKSIDEYYGATGIGERDAILLWRASSSLSHGERWFRDLAKGAVAADLESPRFTDIVTHRSLDVVCSGVHILWLRAVALAAEPS